MSSSRPARRTTMIASAVTTAALTAALVVLPATVGSAASGAGDTNTIHEVHEVPGDGVFDIVGMGFGHGHGLSQYGAKGRGAAGQALNTIMSAYYPGTSAQRGSNALLTVILTNSGAEGLAASSPNRYQVDYSSGGTANAGVRIAPQTGLQWRRLDSTTWTTLPASVGGHTVVAWGARPVSATQIRTFARTAGGWTAYGQADSSGFAFARGAATTRMHYQDGAEVDYPGRIEIRRTGPTTIARLNAVPMESYLRGVVPREMPASWPARALQAQAVAARTYAWWDRQHPKTWYHTCDSTYCQVYRGIRARSRWGTVTAADPRSDRAITDTARLLLVDSGRAAFTQFSASNGGWKSAGGPAYLAAGPDAYDAFPTWHDTLSAHTLQRAYPSVGTLDRIVITRREGGGATWGGRVILARLEGHVSGGATRTVTVSGDTLRRLGGFKSTLFTLS